MLRVKCLSKLLHLALHEGHGWESSGQRSSFSHLEHPTASGPAWLLVPTDQPQPPPPASRELIVIWIPLGGWKDSPSQTAKNPWNLVPSGRPQPVFNFTFSRSIWVAFVLRCPVAEPWTQDCFHFSFALQIVSAGCPIATKIF